MIHLRNGNTIYRSIVLPYFFLPLQYYSTVDLCCADDLFAQLATYCCRLSGKEKATPLIRWHFFAADFSLVAACT